MAAALRSSRFLSKVLCRTIARQGTSLQSLNVSGLQNAQPDRGYADMAFTFASPSMVYYKGVAVKQVDVPSFSGSFGILPDHVPTLAVLRPGVMTVHEADGNTKKYFVSSGSITVNDDSSVQILAEEACTVDQLDAGAVREGVNKATSEIQSAGSDFAKAEAAIALECYEALQKAIDHP